MRPKPLSTQARKRPKQARSQETVTAILQATARVLVGIGYEKASTNRIAEVAGVSIGTLYQYFPNKAALVAALVDLHVEQMRETFTGLLRDLGEAPLPRAVGVMIHAIVASHQVEPELHRVVIQQLPAVGGRERVVAFQAFCQAVVETWLSMNARRVRPRNHRLAAFVLVHSVDAIVHAAVLEGATFLKDEALEAEVAELVLRYLSLE